MIKWSKLLYAGNGTGSVTHWGSPSNNLENVFLGIIKTADDHATCEREHLRWPGQKWKRLGILWYGWALLVGCVPEKIKVN